MAIIDKILGFFGIRRIILEKPLTLLEQDCGKVLDKINASRDFSWEEDMDREVRYTRNDEEDRNVYVCQWETVKIIHTFKFDESDKVVSAGRIYIDQDEAFLDEIAKKVTSGLKRVYGRVNYRHFGFHDPDDEIYYRYNDDVYLMVYRESGEFDHGKSLRIEYVLNSAICRKRDRKRYSPPRSLSDDRQRILSDMNKNL